MSTVSLGKWLFWNFYNLVIRPKENRVVCIPAEYLRGLKEKAMAELEAQPSIDGKEKPKFIRRTLIEQGSREQIEAYTSLIRQDPINKAPPLFGDTSMKLLMFTNWQRARLYETDFSAASVNKLDGPLFPSYIQAVPGPYEFNDGLILFGKDSAGNYWFGGQRAQRQWGMMEREIEEGMRDV
ncbi:hypothetical protein K4K60_003625 [Colletotrichum sp. SAR11_57]|nr:hypothetical protein K4K60_003625 [Colletotrichum sp. SAR11_57]